MKVRKNADSKFVAEIQAAIKANDGYCPCRVIKTPDTKCICKEFRDQIEDPEFEGYCHCELYYKAKEEE